MKYNMKNKIKLICAASVIALMSVNDGACCFQINDELQKNMETQLIDITSRSPATQKQTSAMINFVNSLIDGNTEFAEIELAQYLTEQKKILIERGSFKGESIQKDKMLDLQNECQVILFKILINLYQNYFNDLENEIVDEEEKKDFQQIIKKELSEEMVITKEPIHCQLWPYVSIVTRQYNKLRKFIMDKKKYLKLVKFTRQNIGLVCTSDFIALIKKPEFFPYYFGKYYYPEYALNERLYEYGKEKYLEVKENYRQKYDICVSKQLFDMRQESKNEKELQLKEITQLQEKNAQLQKEKAQLEQDLNKITMNRNKKQQGIRTMTDQMDLLQ